MTCEHFAQRIEAGDGVIFEIIQLLIESYHWEHFVTVCFSE